MSWESVDFMFSVDVKSVRIAHQEFQLSIIVSNVFLIVVYSHVELVSWCYSHVGRKRV